MSEPDCIRCEEVANHGANIFPIHRFIVCPECGNKRCPKATDHRLACTGSNEPNQPGSDHYFLDSWPAQPAPEGER